MNEVYDFPIFDPFANESIGILDRQLKEYNIIIIRDSLKLNRLIIELYEGMRKFFDGTDRDKQQLQGPVDGLAGYFNLSHETAIKSDFPDYKEFIHLLSNQSIQQEVHNSIKESCPELYEKAVEATQLFDRYCFAVIQKIEEYLSLAKGSIADLCLNSVSVLRLLHYPVIDKVHESKAPMAYEHTGIQLLGLQPPATHPGIEFCRRDGSWFKLNMSRVHDCIIVNIGETLQLLSGGTLPATVHRVARSHHNCSRSRYASVYFCHVNMKAKLKNLISDDGLKEITAHDWIQKRINEISERENF